MNPFLPLMLLIFLFGAVILVSLIRSVRIVPGKVALVVERLGKYSRTLDAGFHVLVPFIERVKYKHGLKEMAVDVPAQDCFTQDNVKVRVDGVLYMKVVDARRASYGITNYQYATIQLAQTTMRSVIGRLELDKTFEERDAINAEVVKAVDEAADAWGVKVSRYEIQNINVPSGILEAMEVQMRAEREKRAAIARSLGEKESKINYSQAEMEEAVNRSEGVKEKMINEAEGKAQEILSLARATAEGIKLVARSVANQGGEDALALRVAEGYIEELSKLAKKQTRVVVPMDVTDMSAMMTKAERMVKE
ncbi:SPFH domain-containing protein [Sediminispirochaeta bajacaliforniensis]|uniref:SPFH domain-containing protein n=1 Tax=Sediminispirochaeta bajacaliforniensis TaxID=148 RepID=UPI00035D9540|nr:stomatin-like protein [Sediminispirochaeta bajacaliforniensis]